MRSLGVKCKSCGSLFGTGIVMGAYGKPVLASFALPCPACGQAGAYGSDDLVLLV